MKAGRSGLLQYLLLIAVAILVLLFFTTRALDLASHNRRIDLLTQLEEVEGEMDRNVLKTTAFLLRQYDPFVDVQHRLKKLLNSLAEENSSLVEHSETDFELLLQEYRRELDTKISLLERIKSRAALVRNGLQYLPLPVQRLNEESQDIGGPLVLLLNKLLRFKLFPGEFEEREIRGDIDRLSLSLVGEGDVERSLENILFHMTSVLRYIDQLQALQDRYMRVSTQDRLDKLKHAYQAHYAEHNQRAVVFSYVLLLLSATLFAGLGYAMRRLAAAQARSERSWNQLHDAVESLTEAFALFSSQGRLVLSNSRYRETYPWLKDFLRPGTTLQEIDESNRANGVHRSAGGSTSAQFPCSGRDSYVEELSDGRWLRASDSCTSAGELVFVRFDITEIKRNEVELRKLYRALEQSPASVVITDTGGNIEYVNPKFEEITGYTSEEVLGQNPRVLKSGDKTEEEYKNLWDTILAGRVWRGQFHNKRKDGSIYWEAASISPVRDEAGTITHFIAVKEDITARKRAEDQLRMNATVFETTTEAIMVTDENNVIKTVNPAFARITGFEPEDVVGKNPKLLSSGRHDREFYDQMWRALKKRGYWSGEIWNRRKDGSVYPEWLSLAAIYDDQGRIREHVGVFSDITQRKQNEEQIRRQANYDALTGLPNRSLLVDRLASSLKSAYRESWRVALLFVDLDRFKEVNDSLGHVVGDKLLQLVAERLIGCVRETDTVSRFGGDEFVIVLEDIQQANDVAEIAKKILHAMGKSFPLAGREVFVGASIGITLYPDDTDDADSMLRNADMAMYRAKDAGRNNYQFFTLAMNEQVQQRIELEQDLRQALKKEQLELFYQPLVAAADGRMVAVEALIRWHHPQRGLVAPDQFIPLAEETGLIGPIGYWTLHAACAQGVAWRQQGLDLVVNVNLSSRQLMLGLEVKQVQAVLQEHGLQADRLHLEITEGLMMEGNGETVQWMNEVRDLGVGLSVDDFGTGYSSLSYLKRFPLHTLKIDREFVRDLPQDQGDASLVRAIVAMAYSLGLEVVAEGVETREQLDFLRQTGCDVVQGYYFSKPLPADQLLAYAQAEREETGDSLPSGE